MTRFALYLLLLLVPVTARVEPIAFWPFDEPTGLYPSSALADHAGGGGPLILGPGGSLVAGKFGRALSTTEQAVPALAADPLPEGAALFGLAELPTPSGRTVPPMNWGNAHFSALNTAGEKHLRKEVAQPNPSKTGLNLSATDWTVEFWYQTGQPPEDPEGGVVFELGTGPRGEGNQITALWMNRDLAGFTFVNQAGGVRQIIPSDSTVLHHPGVWAHYAFVHDATTGTLIHYVNGQCQSVTPFGGFKALPAGEEAYFSVGRDAHWRRPLPGALDEMRISSDMVYAADFAPPASLVKDGAAGAPTRKATITQPLLFAQELSADGLIALGSRRHLLVDDALFPVHQNVTFAPTPPQKVELAFAIEGSFRKHVSVIEDESGLIRIYSPVGKTDRLAVRTSQDGLHFDTPHLSDLESDHPNIVTAESAGTQSVFIDPLAPPAERWKLVSGDEGSGIYLFTSADGYRWQRVPTAAIPARSGSQSNMFYDDQRGQYVGYHRTDSGRNVFGKTERRFVTTILDSLQPPWPFHPLTAADYAQLARTVRLHPLQPWYLDNGPLTPGGVGPEYPLSFRPTDDFDPPATDMYVPKAVKYGWAPDVYLAFPCVYFHYQETRPSTRSQLGEPSQGRGSGPIETQLMTSRDGVNWKRYPRPVWLNVGLTEGWDIHQTYMAHGMIRRGDEIWMYSYNTEEYHSPRKKKARRGIFRTVQRLDRFVAVSAPYDRAGMLYSRPFTFTGNRLVLNVDTGASGEVQVGLLEGDGRAIPGYGVDDCVYVNGNELKYEVEWLGQGSDLAKFAGHPVRLVVKMRGASLYALQFLEK